MSGNAGRTSGGGQVSLPEAVKLGAIAALVMVLMAYPGIGLIRELAGQRGVALSPLLLLPAIVLVMAVACRYEWRIQQQSWWPKVRGLWYWAGVSLGTLVPLAVALLWPQPVWPGLPVGVPTVICIAPIPLVLYLVRARVRWKRRRGSESDE